MLSDQEKDTSRNWGAAKHFEVCIAELIKAKEAMTTEAVTSQDPEKVRWALIKLLESNKSLIASLDNSYKTLHDARLRFQTGS